MSDLITTENLEALDDVERMLFLITQLKCEHQLFSVQIARAPSNYFDLNYDERIRFLGAPSTYHLCKTIIMQNTKYQTGIEAFKNAA